MNKSIRLVLLLSCLLAAPLHAQTSTDRLEARLAQVSGREKMEVLAALVEAHRSNDPVQAIAYGREALALLRTYPDAGLEGKVWFHKGSAHYVVSEYDSALVHAERLRELAQTTGNTRGLADAASLMGRVHRRQGDYEQALTFYQRALDHFEELGDPSGAAHALDYIGLIYRNQGDYDQALDFHLRALEINEALGNKQGVAITLNNIGHVHRNLGDYDQALDFYRRALDIKEELGDKRGVAIALFSIGEILLFQGGDEEALDLFLRALDIDEELGDKHGIAITLNKIGEAYHSLGNYDQALDFYRRALEIFEEIGDKSGVAIGLISIGAIHQELGNSNQALAATQRALVVAEGIGAQDLMRDGYKTLAGIYEGQGQFEDALIAYQQYKAAHDLLFNSKSQAAIAELQTRYRTKEQQQQIELLHRQRQIQRLWLGGLVGGLVLLVLVAFLIYSRYRLKNRANRALEKVNTILEESMRLLTETQDRLIHIVEGTASVTGDEFFRALVRNLGFALRVRYVFVSEFTEVNTRVRMLVFWSKEGFLDHVEYDLAGTPCEQVLHGEMRHYPEGIQALFPEDQDLVDLGAESYMAIPLLDLSGNVLGHLAVLDDRPMPVELQDMAILKIFAARAAAELERNRAEETLRKSEERYRDLYEELKTTQAQLVQQEKLASLGQLTAGIAHEIKNPLNFVNNFAALSVDLADELREVLVARAPREGDEPLEDLHEILADLKFNAEKISEHGRRADGIIRSMLEHARIQTGERRATDVNALLEQYLTLAYHGMRVQHPDFTVEIERDYDEALGPVEIVPQEMGRVFLNLLNNAFEAVHDKALSEEKTYAPSVAVHTCQGADLVEIRVRDNGAGVPAEIKDKIFEPFFTTKPAGSGTGLGLSLSHEIVVQGHGGTLTVERAEGEGAMLVITLPRDSRSIASRISRNGSATHAP